MSGGSDTDFDPDEGVDGDLGEDIQTEGSVTTADGSFVIYPNGLKVTIRSIKPDSDFSLKANQDERAFNLAVRVLVTYANTGSDPYAFGITNAKLTYGDNWYEAQNWVGDTDLPGRLVPGTSTDEAFIFTLPKDHGPLRLTVSPDSDALTSYTFTDVETILK